MPVMVQIRNVPSELHRELKARAALEGMSLSDYLLRELRHALDRPTLDEMRERLSRRQSARPHPAPAVAVRAERKSRSLSSTRPPFSMFSYRRLLPGM